MAVDDNIEVFALTGAGAAGDRVASMVRLLCEPLRGRGRWVNWKVIAIAGLLAVGGCGAGSDRIRFATPSRRT